MFGPEISENLACKKAVDKGKVRAVEYTYGSEIEYVAEQKCHAEPEVKIVEKRVLVDRKTGNILDPNERSGSLVCLAFSILGPASYNNPMCHAYLDKNNPYVDPNAPVVPYTY